MNGLSTYLLADICFVNVDVNMDTPGQRPVVDDLPDAARSYAPGHVDGFVEATLALLDATGLRGQALRAARDRYCWNVEKEAFLNVIQSTLGEIREPSAA